MRRREDTFSPKGKIVTYMFKEVGTVAGIFIIMLYISVLMDAFVMFNIMIRKIAEVKEYAAAVLKWPKIAILFISAAVMLAYPIVGNFSVYTVVIELLLCVLLLADGIISTIIKKKYGS